MPKDKNAPSPSEQFRNARDRFAMIEACLASSRGKRHPVAAIASAAASLDTPSKLSLNGLPALWQKYEWMNTLYPHPSLANTALLKSCLDHIPDGLNLAQQNKLTSSRSPRKGN